MVTHFLQFTTGVVTGKKAQTRLTALKLRQITINKLAAVAPAVHGRIKFPKIGSKRGGSASREPQDNKWGPEPPVPRFRRLCVSRIT